MEKQSEEKKSPVPFWKRFLRGSPEPETQAPEQQNTPVAEAPSAPPPPLPPLMVIPDRERPFWKLWELWREGLDWAPQPNLSLDQPAQEGILPLTRADLERETARLGPALEQWAERRLPVLAHEPDTPPPNVDSSFFIHVGLNKMAAWALLVPPSGDGAGPSSEKLAAELKKAGVKWGVYESSLSWLSDPSGHYFELRPVAGGMPPVEGKDGAIVEKFTRERVRSVVTDGQGNVDYRALNYYQFIAKGDAICDIIPPEEGTPGMRISGERVPARPVKPATAPKGSNTDLSPDGAHLIAAMDGHVEFSGGVFQVKPTLEVHGDVDYSTGNITFRGDVHISGDVRENFFVRATGKVAIDGLVEGATVEADGDVIIAKGVLGNNKALIRSKTIVRAKYLENCVVYSGECTYADCVMASQIFSDGKINVTTGRGTVIGGCLTAAEQIECRIIGSKSGLLTEVILGQLPYIQDEMKDNEITLDAIRKESTQLDKKLALMENQPASPQEAKELSKLKLRRSVLALKEDKLTKRQDELQGIKPDLTKCRFICITLYPTTRIVIGSESRVMDTEWTQCTAFLAPETHEIIIS